jgi:flavin reductase (DIM6/NTAB) family NADH-FMN oxidoreductase RutF
MFASASVILLIDVPISKAIWLISPRITALINTLDEKGELNSSPYSFVYPLSASPPLVGVGIGGKHKLTYVNSKRTNEFVVCIVSETYGQQAVNCEEAHKPGDKLWEKQGFHTEKSKIVSVPRITESRAILECRVRRFIELDGDHLILVGEVVHAEGDELGVDGIRPLLHDSNEKFRAVGTEIILQRRR